MAVRVIAWLLAVLMMGAGIQALASRAGDRDVDGSAEAAALAEPAEPGLGDSPVQDLEIWSMAPSVPRAAQRHPVGAPQAASPSRGRAHAAFVFRPPRLVASR